MERSGAKAHKRTQSKISPKKRKEAHEMLSSEYRHGVDPKNRLFIPVKFRDKLGEEIVISESVRKNCLKVCSVAEWDKYLKSIEEKFDKADSEYLLRVINGSSVTLPFDSAGRVQLTTDLIKFAGLEKRQVVIVGCGEYAEIWNESDYAREVKEADRAELRRKLESKGL